MSVQVRPGGPQDLGAVAAIQSACPEAAQWNPVDYLDHVFLVAAIAGQVAGFAVFRAVVPGEGELLNLGVAPEWRKKGVGRALLGEIISRFPGTIFLEVRASNRGALDFYNSLHFQRVGIRPEYYLDPPESAVVLKFHSC